MKSLAQNWLFRQVVKVVAPVAAAVGATDATVQIAAFAVAGATFLVEVGLSWVANKRK
jgi:hypothetical protein